MSGLLILILIFIIVPIIWHRSAPYVYRWAQRRTADYVRRSMGMPPRDRDRSDTAGSRSSSFYGRSRRPSAEGPLIPKEYAVDVDYTEVHSYSSEEAIASDGGSVRYTRESQVSDAEIIEIRKDR